MADIGVHCAGICLERWPIGTPTPWEVGAFYWTALAPHIVNSGKAEQDSISMQTAWGVLPPRDLWGLTWRASTGVGPG